MAYGGEAAAASGPGAGGRDGAFLGASAALFLASAAGTVAWCGSMQGGMPMPGGWTMSMTWMRMPGQTWLGAAASFLGMWALMMTAMMLPSLVPMLSSYRRSLRGVDAARLGRLTAVAGAGYLAAWTIAGAAVYPLGVALGAAEMRWPAVSRLVPAATGAVLLLAGGLQLSGWKARQLGRCRGAPGCAAPVRPDLAGAWRRGLELGLHCIRCCSAFTAVLLVAGVMDLAAMAAVAAAITAERLAPWPGRVARATGAGVVALGAAAIARALSG